MKKKLALALCFLAAGEFAVAQTADGRSGAPTGTNTSANQSQNNNQQGSQIAGVMSTVFTATGGAMLPSCGVPGGQGTCVMGIILVGFGVVANGQSRANGATAGYANGTGIATNGYGFGNSDYNSGANTDGTLGGALTPEQLKKSQDTQKLLTTTGIGGVKVNPKTGAITTPDGKTYTPKDFSSPEAMQAAGFSGADANGAFAAAKRIEADATAKVAAANAANKNSLAGMGGFDEGGGGGGSLNGKGGSNGSADDGTSGGAGGAGGLGGKNGKNGRGLAGAGSVAGLTKNYNGDPIGVSEDNIFNMMTRRYKLKEKQDSFFSDAELIKK